MKALLQSLNQDIPESWMNLILPATHILIILLISWLLMRVSSKLVKLFREYVARATHDAGSIKRAETLSQVFSNVAVVVISLITGMLILGEFGISIAPILAAAGVVGVAVGFGAQSLIKDFFNGFFLLIEDQLRHGEAVEINGKSGQVEEVTLRHVRLRDSQGSVHFIPNNSISMVTNKSRDFAFAVMDIGIAYRENIRTVFELLRATGAEMRKDAVWGALIIEDLEIAGVEDLADSAVIVRCRFKVLPLEHDNVRREFLLRIKEAFDAQGIEIPYPHLTLYAGTAKNPADTAPFKIQKLPLDL